MKINRTKIIIAIPAAITLIAVTVLISTAFTDTRPVITGMVETASIDVASKIPGRIDSIAVHEGDNVNAGDVLATLSSKEMDAKVEQARGAMQAAQARLSLAQHGARKEEKEGALKLYQQAKHQFELAEKTWKRISAVYKDSLISTQERDQVEFQYLGTQEQMEAAFAKYQMALNGTRPEEIEGAQSLYHQAENAYNEAMAYHDELSLKAPLTGEIYKKISEPGEIIGAGYPIFTIINPNDSWVVLNLREDQMKGMTKGALLNGIVTALGNQVCQFTVSYIAPMGDFATWRATNQKGDVDLKTFEIHLRPVHPISGLRPGMSVHITL